MDALSIIISYHFNEVDYLEVLPIIQFLSIFQSERALNVEIFTLFERALNVEIFTLFEYLSTCFASSLFIMFRSPV
jgi:hypothetical protein